VGVLHLLLSHDGVKADTWITEFVGRAVQRRLPSERAGALVNEAAESLEVKPKELDHAIWSYASSTPAEQYAGNTLNDHTQENRRRRDFPPSSLAFGAARRRASWSTSTQTDNSHAQRSKAAS